MTTTGDTLIIISKQYPFSHKEAYLESEIQVLSQQWQQIYIYPSDHFKTNDNPHYSLPQNVKLIDLNNNLSRISKVDSIFLFLRAWTFELIKHDRPTRWVKDVKRNFHIFITQYAIAKTFNNFLGSDQCRGREITLYSYWFSSSALFLAIMKSEGWIKRFVSRAHSIDLYHEKWGFINEKTKPHPFKNFKFRHVDQIFSISEHGLKYLQTQNINTSKLSVSYLGVTDYGLNPSNAPDEPFTILTCSGLDKNKRLELLAKAIKHVDYPIRWIHFGDGPNRQIILDELHQSMVEIEIKGQTNNTEIRKYLTSNAVDVFINISKVEGLPVSIMEALSHGIPVIATGVNGTPEAVISDYNGKTLRVDFTIEEILKSIDFIRNHPEKTKLRHQARKHYENHFNAQWNYRNFSQTLMQFAAKIKD